MDVLPYFKGDARSLSHFILGDNVCGWAGNEAFDCPDLEAASGVRIYSLRKPREDELIFGGSSSEWSCALYYCDRNNTLLHQEM